MTQVAEELSTAVKDSNRSEISFGATPTLGFSTTRYSQPEVCTPAGCTNSRLSITGFYINPTSPEEATEVLRNARPEPARV